MEPTTTFQTNSRPGWIGDFLNREHLLAGGARIDAARFQSADAIKVTVGVAGALADATAVPVTALAGELPAGTVLDFGAKKFARLTQKAAKGATALVVAALVTALAANDTALYNPLGAPKRVPSGTVVGATYAEIEAAAVVTDGKPAGLDWGPAEATDDVLYLVVYDILDADTRPNAEFYRHGSLVKVNNLPNYAALPAGVKTKLRAAYECTIGATES